MTCQFWDSLERSVPCPKPGVAKAKDQWLCADHYDVWMHVQKKITEHKQNRRLKENL